MFSVEPEPASQTSLVIEATSAVFPSGELSKLSSYEDVLSSSPLSAVSNMLSISASPDTYSYQSELQPSSSTLGYFSSDVPSFASLAVTGTVTVTNRDFSVQLSDSNSVAFTALQSEFCSEVGGCG